MINHIYKSLTIFNQSIQSNINTKRTQETDIVKDDEAPSMPLMPETAAQLHIHDWALVGADAQTIVQW